MVHDFAITEHHIVLEVVGDSTFDLGRQVR